MARYGADQAAMSAGQDITTGPGGGNPLLINPLPIIPVVPVLPVVPSNPTRSDYNDAARPVSERTLTIAGAGTLLPTIFGLDQTGAKITAIVDYGANLILRCEWCTGGIDSVNALYMDDAVAPAGVIATHYDGSQVTADATLVAAFAAKGKTYTDTLNGVCYSTLVVPPGLGNGFPRFVAEIKGKKIAQTSGGTPAYTQNGVWFIAWLITQRLQESINWASFTAAATASGDTMVGSPAEKKRILGLTLDNEQSVTQWISLLLGYTGCALWYDNGEWGITAETATYTAPFSVTEALMKDGEIDVQSRNVKNAPTVVRIWYTNTSAIPWREEYAEASMPGAGSTLPYLLSEVRMPAIQRHSHAYREAYEQLYDYQLGDLTASFVTRDQGLKIMPGDVFPITHSIGFSAKPFRCVSMPEPVDAGRWRVQTREFDPAKYSTAVVTGPTFTDTSLPSPGNPPTVGAVTLTEEVVTVPSGALPLSKIRATWAALSTWPFIAGYRVVVKTLAGVTVDSADVPAAEYISPPLNAATTYNVLVYARSSIAVSATASIASISLVSTGIGALASVWSQAISRADIGSWTFGDLVETYQLYPGDNTLRIRTKCTVVETSVYTGANELTPGLATDLLDAGSFLVSPVTVNASLQIYNRTAAQSPGYSVGASRTAVFALLNIANWVALYNGNMRVGVYVDTIYWANASTFLATGSTVAVVIQSEPKGGGYFGPWQIEFDAATIAAMMPTVTDPVVPTPSSSASGGVVVQLPRKYITITNVQITAQSSSQANPSYTNLNVSETTLANNNLTLHCYDGTNARVAVPCSILITGVPA